MQQQAPSRQPKVIRSSRIIPDRKRIESARVAGECCIRASVRLADQCPLSSVLSVNPVLLSDGAVPTQKCLDSASRLTDCTLETLVLLLPIGWMGPQDSDGSVLPPPHMQIASLIPLPVCPPISLTLCNSCLLILSYLLFAMLIQPRFLPRLME